MECPHLGSHVKVGVSSMTKKTNGDTIPSWFCQVCRSTKSPWMCLECGIITCGRYVNGHAKQHWEECQHCACINCLSLGVFCYECDEFVVNDTRAGTVKEVRHYLEDVQNAQLNKQQKNNLDIGDEDYVDGPPKKRQATNSNKQSILGLRNLGNTCFMNAVLQSLSNIHQFAGFFKELPAVELRSGKTAGKRIYNTRNLKHDDVSLVEELRRVLCALMQGSGSAISPDSLFTVMWKIFPRFRGYQQQDAHEFMRYLLDRLHSELQGSLWPNQTRQSSTNGKSTIVTVMFGGLLLSEVHCRICGSFFKKIDPFLDISLDIPEQFRVRGKQKDSSNVCKLEDCIRQFTEIEELAESEHYMCTQCRKRQPSTKKFTVRCLPNVLCVHIKRFQWTGFLRSKIDTFVKFPAKELDLKPYLLKPKEEDKNGTTCMYDLAAVVVHQGSGAGCGHYIAFAKQDGQWFCFNDSSVSPVEEKTVLRCKAYLLFYTCRKYQQNDHFQLAQVLQEEITHESSNNKV
ncbi:ubiquitin carboxyl-terminal hydrolase 3-like [Amphiura filiformis]|uniref:ubiquitin carboxyl-terminal hydrolase 3-like n=1 Tax=Amphiura filiformis TaxID=82378 RepID=UPI003B225F9B